MGLERARPAVGSGSSGAVLSEEVADVFDDELSGCAVVVAVVAVVAAAVELELSGALSEAVELSSPLVLAEASRGSEDEALSVLLELSAELVTVADELVPLDALPDAEPLVLDEELEEELDELELEKRLEELSFEPSGLSLFPEQAVSETASARVTKFDQKRFI